MFNWLKRFSRDKELSDAQVEKVALQFTALALEVNEHFVKDAVLNCPFMKMSGTVVQFTPIELLEVVAELRIFALICACHGINDQRVGLSATTIVRIMQASTTAFVRTPMYDEESLRQLRSATRGIMSIAAYTTPEVLRHLIQRRYEWYTNVWVMKIFPKDSILVIHTAGEIFKWIELDWDSTTRYQLVSAMADMLLCIRRFATARGFELARDAK